MSALDIVVSPTDRASMYRAELDGRHLVTARTPLFAAARVLRDEGMPHETPITMRWTGRTSPTMSSTVGQAAGLSVIEDDSGTQFTAYRPGPDARMPASSLASDRQRPRAALEVVR